MPAIPRDRGRLIGLDQSEQLSVAYDRERALIAPDHEIALGRLHVP
jgi:hypothetical protein